MRPVFEFGSNHVLDLGDFDHVEDPNDPEATTAPVNSERKPVPPTQAEKVDLFIAKIQTKLQLMDRRLDQLELALRELS